MSQFNFSDILNDMRKEERKNKLQRGVELCTISNSDDWEVVRDLDGEAVPPKSTEACCRITCIVPKIGQRTLDLWGFCPENEKGEAREGVEIVIYAPDGVNPGSAEARRALRRVGRKAAATETPAATETKPKKL